MRAMFPLGLAAGWGRLVTAFVTAVALLWAGSLLGVPAGLWGGPIAAALACALILLTWRRAALLTLIASVVSRRAGAGPGQGGGLGTVAPTVGHRLRWTAISAAIRGAGHDMIAVVAVDGPSHIPSVLDHHRVQSAATLPVSVVAEALRQFGVTLSGIDILSVGRRRAAKTHHHYAATYSRIVGDHPAVGRRRTWCVLRMNSLDNVAAVASRDSVAATLAVCAQRLATELTARHCPARVVAGVELADIDTALVAGLGHARARWGGLRHEGGSVTTYWVSPADIGTATLDRVWVPDSDYTATAVQLRPTAQGGVSVGMLVRYGTGGPLREPPLTGLNPLSGRHDLGLRAGLADALVPALRAPHRRLAAGEDLRAPIGATGLIIGATPARHPLLLNLGAAAPTAAATVTVAGELAVLVQLAQRAAATGYEVLVCSQRSPYWREAIASGLRVVAELPEELPGGGRDVMVVLDHVAARAPAAAVTVRAVEPGSASVADVHLEQDSPHTAAIRTADFQYRVHIDVDAERNMIGVRPRPRVA